MQIKSLFSLVLASALLSACATTNNSSSSNTVDLSNKLNVDGLSPLEKIEAYENQLITNKHTKYATFY